MDKCHKIIIYILSFFIFMAMSSHAQAQAIGKIIFSTGACYATTGGSKRALSRGSDIFMGETITTGSNSNLQIRFTDNGLVALRPDSQYAVNSYQFNQTNNQANKFGGNLAKGQLRMLSGLINKKNPGSVTLKTKTSVIGLQGTDLECTTSRFGDLVIVFDGNVNVSTATSEISIGEGQNYNAAVVNAETDTAAGMDIPDVNRTPDEVSVEEVKEELENVAAEEEEEKEARIEQVFMNSVQEGISNSVTEETFAIEDELELEELAELHDEAAAAEEEEEEPFDADEDHV